MISIRNLNKYYKSKGEVVHALKDVNLQFPDKGFIVILGKSGSGKSTLLNILGGLDFPDEGDINIDGVSSKAFKLRDWDSYRNSNVGFVFQEFYIIDELSIGDNVRLALELQGYDKEKINTKVDDILKQVELESYKKRLPSELSGGQRQRVAIARALTKDPKLILADEPTGNLDHETGTLILSILKEISKSKLVIMVTHDEEYAKQYGDRIIEIKDGMITYDSELIDHNQVFYENEDEIIIKLEKGKELSKEIVDYLNHISEQVSNGYLITISDEEGIHDKLTINKNVDSIEEVNRSISYKKYSLPFRHAFKLAFNSIKNHKLKFTLTFFLFSIALTFLGLASNFTFYDMGKVTSNTYMKENMKEILLLKFERRETRYRNKYYLYYDGRQLIYTKEDLKKMRDKYPHLKFALNYPSINNTSVIVYEDGLPLELLFGAFPKDNEILLTDYNAKFLIDGITYRTMNDLIGSIYLYENQELVISGIVNTSYEDFETIYQKSKDYDMYERALLSRYDRIYMNQFTFEHVMNHDTFSIKFNNVNFPLKCAFNDETQEIISGSHYPNQKDEIVLSTLGLRSLYGEIDENDLSQYLNQTITLSHYVRNSDLYEDKVYKIVGIIPSKRSDEPFQILFHKDEFTEIRNSNNLDIYVYLSHDQNENTQFFKDLTKGKDIRLHQTIYSPLLYKVNDDIHRYQTTFYIIGALFGGIVILLFSSFITMSITDKQKDIGILRALGASGKDIAKIFIIEGLLLSLFSIIISIAGLIGAVYGMNSLIIKDFNTPLVLLYVSYFSIIVMILLTLIVIFLASYVPIKRISQKKPIEAIKQL